MEYRQLYENAIIVAPRNQWDYFFAYRKQYPKANFSLYSEEDLEDLFAYRHGKLNKIYTGLRANLVVGDSATIKNRYALTRPYVGLILQILNELDEGLQSFKRYYRSFDFADIASLARQAAKIPEINAELKARYRYIMIDEYQDTSDLQEAFISTIAQDNVFAVGDIKQSIYRFRNANPTLFLKRYQAYEKERGGHLITLAENFRSRSSVLNDINSIFAVLMTSHLGGVDYDHADGRLQVQLPRWGGTGGWLKQLQQSLRDVLRDRP